MNCWLCALYTPPRPSFKWSPSKSLNFAWFFKVDIEVTNLYHFSSIEMLVNGFTERAPLIGRRHFVVDPVEMPRNPKKVVVRTRTVLGSNLRITNSPNSFASINSCLERSPTNSDSCTSMHVPTRLVRASRLFNNLYSGCKNCKFLRTSGAL